MKKICLFAFLALFMIRVFASPPGPSSAAPPPTANASTVLSLLGNHYTAVANAAGTGTWYPNWGQQTQVAYSNIGGSDTTIRYSNLNYQGVQFNGALNVSGMDSIHFDIWSSTCTKVNFHLIWGGENGPDITLNSGSWTSVTLPLNTTVFPGANFANIVQFKFTGVTPTSGSTIYLENVYFRQAAGKPVITGFSLPSQTAGTTYTITDPTSTSPGAFTYTSSNTAIATVSGNTVTYVAGGTCTITANQAASGSYQAGTATATLVVAFPVPTTAAPTPTRDAANVLSVFGKHYTQNSAAAGTAVWHQGWGDATSVSYTNIGGDTTMVGNNYNYQGVQFSSALNVSSYDSLHLDIWSPNITKLYIDLIGGAEKDLAYTIPVKAGWNPIDILLSTYTPTVNLSSLLQFKLDITPNNGTTDIKDGGVIYYQNIYFYKKAGGPVITGFNIPTQTYSGSNFTYTITDPTSNSGGAFTYSSGNTSVATVSGNTVTILGAGTSIITCNQAAAGAFLAGSTTATLTVDYATPSTAADAPTDLSQNVVSLYGDTYTNLAGIDWRPNWGQSTTYTATTIGGASTIKYAALNYEGVNLPSDQNISTMDSLRFNVWTPNCTSLKVALINTTGGVVQQFVTVSLTANTWNTISIPLSSFSPVNLAKVQQMSFTTVTPSSGAIIYLQNIYFMNVVGKPTITGFTIPTQTYTGSNFTYTITDPTSNGTGAFTYTSSNTAVATVSGNVITIKSVGTSTITCNQAADASYTAGSVTTVLTVDLPSPSSAAAVPTNNSNEVISLFGDTYTNVAGTNWGPIWGGPTQGQYNAVTIAGKSTLKYSSMGYSGVQFDGGTIDASLMDTIHLDVWTPNCTSFNLFIINTANGANQHVTLTPTTSGWNSFNIPMTSFALVANHVNQFKIEANTPSSGSVLYIQNVYFFKLPGKPTLSAFSMPGSLTTSSAPFTITAPTSNSAGAFTYTSGNTSVATISGNTVTIVGGGTAVITATQAADPINGYIAGSITATLSVAFAGPATAAPVPTSAPGNVISLWGDTYTNVSGTDWYPNWGQPTTTNTITVGGKTTLQYSNLNYQGVQFASPINASTMKTLHMDIWTPNINKMNIVLIGTNLDYTVSLTHNGWNSINIPLSAYSSGLNSIGQFKFTIEVFTPNTGGVIYFQNIYFDNATPVATWVGTTSTDYGVASNWAYGIAPASASDLSIPAAPANQPVLGSNVALNNIVLNGSLDLNGHTVTLNGAVTGTGSLKGSATSSLTIGGTVGTINFNAATNTVQNLTISSGSVTLGNALNVVGLVSSNGGTLNTGGFLTLKSTSIANTAVLGPVTGTITGTATVERFIPQALRTYRDLGTGGVANAGSFFNNWQEGGATTAGKGIYITGKYGASAGVDATTGFDISRSGQASLYAYGAGNWPAVTNTKTTTIDPYQAYRVFVRGDRNFANFGFAADPSNMYSSTAIRTTGNLVTGNVTFSTAGVANTNYASAATKLVAGNGNYSLIANPYACPIDWEAVYANGANQNISSTYWYFDPTFMSGGFATYVSYNAVSHVTSNATSKVNKYIQPGMGFFVQNTGASPVLAITEANKAAGSTKTAVYRTVAPNYLQVSLWKNVNGENTNIDGTVAVFNTEFTKVIGDKDSKKLNNGGENLYITQSNTDLSIAGLPIPTVNDEIALNLSQLVAGTTYQINVDASQFSTNGMDVFIKDKLLNTYVVASEGVSFIATKDAASYQDRFSVVFKKVTVSPVIVKGSVAIYPNPVSNNKINLQMSNLEKGTYTVRVINNLGQEVMNSTISNESGNTNKTITAKGLTTGVYTLQVTGKSRSERCLL